MLHSAPLTLLCPDPMPCLFQQLAVMLIIQQLVNNFQEALLPIVIRRTYSKARCLF